MMGRNYQPQLVSRISFMDSMTGCQLGMGFSTDFRSPLSEQIPSKRRLGVDLLPGAWNHDGCRFGREARKLVGFLWEDLSILWSRESGVHRDITNRYIRENLGPLKKDGQVGLSLSLGDGFGFLLFFRVVSGDERQTLESYSFDKWRVIMDSNSLLDFREKFCHAYSWTTAEDST